MTLIDLPPGVILILGAIIVPFLSHRPRQIWMLGLITLSALQAWSLTPGIHLETSIIGLDLILNRANAFTQPFSLVFHIAAAINVFYAMNGKSRVTDASGLAYAGAAIAALFAGDFATLFIYWELTAITSVLLILQGTSQRRLGAAMRYLLMQVTSGVVLLGGAALLWDQGAGLVIGPLDATSLAGGMILFAFGIKAAFPLLNGWLQDAYPEASVSGTVMLSAFTTKLSIFMLAQCFVGLEWLIYIGAIMAVFPVLFAAVENDLRRVLAFSLNSQLGFMVVGIGIGTELALNGTVAHAFASTLYKGLLFMTMGAVLLRAGTTKVSELGGLWRSMPLTASFCIIGALSISSFPLFSGFVTKSLTIGATLYEGHFYVWLALIFASIGALQNVGIRIPYFTFFGNKRSEKLKEAPRTMLFAMALASGLCIVIGLYPQPLYALLPYEVTYTAWSASHVLSELQLLMFGTLAFVFMLVRGLTPPAIDSTLLNSDWFFRKLAPKIIMTIFRPLWASYSILIHGLKTITFDLIHYFMTHLRLSGFGPGAMGTGLAGAIFLAIFTILLALKFSIE